MILTSLSKTQALSACSNRRQCQSCWLLLSRHFQCMRKYLEQLLLMSSSLFDLVNPHTFSCFAVYVC